MIIKKADINIEHFAKGKVFDYSLPDGKIGISYQEHNERVSNKGWGVNKMITGIIMYLFPLVRNK